MEIFEITLVTLLLLLSNRAYAQNSGAGPPTCQDASSYFQSGNTGPVISYAQQLYEKWNDAEMTAGQPTVDFPSDQSNLDMEIGEWKMSCIGYPDKLLEDAIRSGYQISLNIKGAMDHPFGN